MNVRARNVEIVSLPLNLYSVALTFLQAASDITKSLYSGGLDIGTRTSKI